MKCLGVDTSLVGDIGLFSTIDGPASSWNCLHGSVSCSLCLRAYVARYLPPVGSYGFHSSGGGRGGGCSTSGGASSIGLLGSGSDLGSMYNSIEKCSRLCFWLQRRGERVHCSGEGGLNGSGGGLGHLGGDGDWVGDKGCIIGGTWGWDSCGKADGKMTAWFLVSGAGVIDRAGSDDKDGSENEGE